MEKTKPPFTAKDIIDDVAKKMIKRGQNPDHFGESIFNFDPAVLQSVMDDAAANPVAERKPGEKWPLTSAELAPDYLSKNPGVMWALKNLAVPHPQDRQKIMEDFMKHWCVQCPIMRLYLTPDVEISFEYNDEPRLIAAYANREPISGTPCPIESLDTCPTLIQIQKVQNILAEVQIKAQKEATTNGTSLPRFTPRTAISDPAPASFDAPDSAELPRGHDAPPPPSSGAPQQTPQQPSESEGRLDARPDTSAATNHNDSGVQRISLGTTGSGHQPGELAGSGRRAKPRTETYYDIPWESEDN